MLVDTASLSGAILFIVGTATAMAWALTQSGFSRELAAADGQDAGRRGRLHGASASSRSSSSAACSKASRRIVLLGPLLFPIARQIGVHEVHYSMVVILWRWASARSAPPFGAGFLPPPARLAANVAFDPGIGACHAGLAATSAVRRLIATESGRRFLVACRSGFCRKRQGPGKVAPPRAL